MRSIPYRVPHTVSAQKALAAVTVSYCYLALDPPRGALGASPSFLSSEKLNDVFADTRLAYGRTKPNLASDPAFSNLDGFILPAAPLSLHSPQLPEKPHGPRLASEPLVALSSGS